MSDGTKLVIVESPTKARTIRKFLGREYRVEASMGHVRDLPASGAEIPADLKEKEWARLGVDVENGFKPIYVIPGGKKRVVAELRKAVKDAVELFLATDEDREGESIGWHLVEVLKPKCPIRRMVFHEITQKAIQEALEHPRDLNNDLVNAQETRRVLDRLVGYTVSPLLWKKVAPKLSAGRVQSVAVRLLVMRERERMAFVSAAYWDLEAKLQAEGQVFEAQATSINGKRIAQGRDFDENTGKIPEGKDVLLLGEAQARRLAEGLKGRPFKVTSLETRQQNRSPQPPFTTSTLQQEANRKLGLSAQRTMRIAQRLYEQGHITYMRTDSTNLAESAVEGIRAMVSERYGADHLHQAPRLYRTNAKGAQEAHEAIRPAGTAMPTAQELELVAEQAKLYELIWKRTVACQMADARLAFTTAQLEAEAGGDTVAFRASGREVTFPGFFRAYVEGSEDPAEALEDQSQPLPALKEGGAVDCVEVEPLQHDTKPPARYTEASLVKALESYGIGRPSTYASIIDTVQRRGYVMAKNKQLVPTFTSMAVTQLLEEALARVVDVDFTAAMEERLDEIAEGKDALGYLREFYKGQLLKGVEGGLAVDAREICMVRAPSLGPHGIRVGRYGAFIEYEAKNGDGEKTSATVSLPTDAAPSDIDQAYIERLVALARRGRQPLGQDDETGKPVFVLVGPYGPYLQLGQVIDPKDKKNRPKRVSVPAGVDPLTIELDKARALLSLPRRIGDHPQSQKAVRAGIGRYGPYVLHDGVYASLKPEDDVLQVGMERALELLADKKPRRRASDPLKELGNHPEDGEPVRVMSGPYGAYVKHGKLNASIPEGFDAEDVTIEEAVIWLEEKAARRGLREAPGEGAAKAPPAAKKKGGKAKKMTADVVLPVEAEAPEKPAKGKKAGKRAAADKKPEKPATKPASRKVALPAVEAAPAPPARAKKGTVKSAKSTAKTVKPGKPASKSAARKKSPAKNVAPAEE